MKSNVPWSVKGIDPEARVVAKAAAKEAGMTLGEWMNHAIRQIGEDDGKEGGQEGGRDDDGRDGAAPAQAAPASGVTTDQLRAVVDSLNRLNERLTSTEEGLRTQEAQTRQTAAGLGQGLETVYERMKRLERERREGASEAIQQRVEKLERGEGDKGRIDGLKRLESALTSMVEALEVTRREAITKIGENEAALDQLAGRVDVLDERLTAGFGEVHDAIDAVGEHLDRTERTAAGVLSDAKAASGSADAEFVEQTSRRLRALGSEIKRSGDQIRTVEEMITRLSAKIEAAEHRSAEGIGEVAASLAGLRAEVGGEAEQARATDDLADAAREADKKVSRLQRSYETMMARLDGRALPEEADGTKAAPQADGASAEPQPPASVAAPEASTAAASAQAAAQATAAQATAAQAPLAQTLEAEVPKAPEAIVPNEGRDDDFDQVFKEFTAPQGADAPTATPQGADAPAAAPAAAPPSPADLPPMLGGALPLAAAGAALTADLPGGAGTDDGGVPKLTARQKVLLAARARKQRLEAEAKAEANQANVQDAPPLAVAPAADVRADPSADEDAAARSGDADDGQNRKLGLALFGLLAVLVAAVAFASFRFFGGDGDAPVVADTGPADRLEARMTAPGLPDPASDADPAPLPSATADSKMLYDQGKTLLARGQEADALRLFEEAAAAGYAPAQFRAGHAYYDGIGTDKNPMRAEAFLSDAAVSGNVVAMHYLGNLAVTGDEPNLAQARDWFEAAADSGVVSSAYNLGYLFDPTVEEAIVPTGERDAAKAYYWYAIAAKQGDEASRQEAELVASRLTPEKTQEIDAQVARWAPRPVSEGANDGVRLPG